MLNTNSAFRCSELDPQEILQSQRCTWIAHKASCTLLSLLVSCVLLCSSSSRTSCSLFTWPRFSSSCASCSLFTPSQPGGFSSTSSPLVTSSSSFASLLSLSSPPSAPGKCHMAHITDAAQLTHPISSAEDVDMQLKPATPRPDMHDIATPQSSIGGRCRKWVVSTQDPSLQKTQVRRLYDSLLQANQDCNNGVTETHNELTCTPNASREASRLATSWYPRTRQTLKRETPSSV